LPGRCGQRDLFVTGPGPDAGGSNQGKDGWDHDRVKAGIDEVPLVALPGGPTPDVAVCPRAGVAIAADNAMKNRRKFRCLCIPTSLSMAML
jgi:hypothetical protein